MTKEEWEGEFFEEYKRRTGISFQEGGGDPDTVFEDYKDWTPSEVVTHQIEKYDLTDLDKEDPWVTGRRRPAPKMRRRRR